MAMRCIGALAPWKPLGEVAIAFSRHNEPINMSCASGTQVVSHCSCSCELTHRKSSSLCAYVRQLRGRVKPFAALAEARTSLGQRQGSRGLASSDPASYRRSSLQQARSSACTAALYGRITQSSVNSGSKKYSVF